jgi:tetratricopeptide (TPR) repeat protein
MLLGYVYLWQKQPEQAIAAGERALALDPNYADAYGALAEILTFAGQPEKAIGLAQQAMRLNPQYPAGYPFQLGMAYNQTGQYAEAISALQDTLRRNPNFLNAYTYLAWSYLYQWSGQWSEDPQTLEHAEEAARQAVALSDSVFYIHGHGERAWTLVKSRGSDREDSQSVWK